MGEVVNVGGVRIAYEIEGDGPLVVLLQGLSMPGNMWMGLKEELVARGFRVVTPDNRGTGLSDAPYRPYWIRQMAADTAAVIDAINEGPAIVMGVSMGGMIAQELAIQHPQKVRALALVSTTCGLPFGVPISAAAIVLLLRALFAPRSMGRSDFARLLVGPAATGRIEEVLDFWRTAHQDRPVRARGILFQLVGAACHNAGRRLGQIAVPTVVLAGEDDFLVPPANSVTLAHRVPQADLRLIDQTGHLLALERPRALVSALEALRTALSHIQADGVVS
jgi:pimeloyl-ACP methyl ester carboxylesterase